MLSPIVHSALILQQDSVNCSHVGGGNDVVAGLVAIDNV